MERYIKYINRFLPQNLGIREDSTREAIRAALRWVWTTEDLNGGSFVRMVNILERLIKG